MKEKVFDFEGTVLYMGDLIRMKEPVDDERFYHSNIGKLFEKGVMDELTLEVCKQFWGEVYFKARYYIKGVPVTNGQLDEEQGHIDCDYNKEPSEDVTGYRFMMYITKKPVTIERSE